MNNRQAFLQQHFEALEYRLEIFSPSNSNYPPIIHNISKGARGPIGYRPLRLLNIKNPALVEGFRTLKVSSHLSADEIVLELALSQRADHEDYSSFHEQPLGTYLIGDGETVELPELAPFGLTPMIVKAIRLTAEDVPLDQLPQKNYTTGLQIVSIRKKGPLHFVTIQNVSDKTICAYNIGYDVSYGGGGTTSHQDLPPGAKDSHLFSFQPHILLAPLPKRQPPPEQEILVIRTLKYEDGSYEGMSPLNFPRQPSI